MRWMTSTLIALGMACAPASTYAQTSPQPQPADENQNQAPGYQQPSEEQTDTYEWSTASGPRLGVMVTGLTPELRQFYGAPAERGVLVARVVPGSPAARAGLRVGDILVAVNRQPISAAGDILSTLSSLDRGQFFPLRVVRDHQMITIHTQLSPAAQPQQPVESATRC